MKKKLNDQQMRFVLELEDALDRGRIDIKSVATICNVYARSFYKVSSHHLHLRGLCMALEVYFDGCRQFRIEVAAWREYSRTGEGEAVTYPCNVPLPAL